jgi:peptidoglycan hydrolase CwlO-like protein
MSNGQNVQKVQLGCGTLILIALIVLFFSSNGGNSGAISNLQTEVRELKTEVTQLKQAIDLQTEQIKTLQNKLDNAAHK